MLSCGAVDNSARQFETAAAGAEELELLSDEELALAEVELSDLVASDFFSVELDELTDSELFAEPLAVLLAASRLSVR